MKDVEGLPGVTQYEATDKLPERFSREARGRLTVGVTYERKGFCHVAESTNSRGVKINAWDGVLLENKETKKLFPASINQLTGTSIVNEGSETAPIWKVYTTSKQLFPDAKSLTAANAAKKFKVVKEEKLPATVYGTTEQVEKPFYLFEKV